MKSVLSFFLLSSEKEGFGFNFNILETNLVNIILLIVLLFYVLGSFLKDNLSSRQEEIITSIQEGESRLSEATQRLNEAKSQWSQAQIIIEEIKSQTKKTNTNLIKSLFNEANQDLTQRFKNIVMVLRYREQQVFNGIIKHVLKAALEDATSKLKTQLNNTDQSLIIDKKINRLGGRL